MKKNIKLKMQDMNKKLLLYAQQYYENNNSLISDFKYDKLYLEYEALEKLHPEFVIENSITNQIGSTISNKFEKIKHETPMLSLANAFNDEELYKFDERIKETLDSPKDVSYLCELKIDGLSVGLIYEKGKLKKGFTRGNGIIGEDITTNIKQIRDIPKTINYQKRIEIRGEVFMRYDVFEKLNSENENNFSNPRNTAAGTLRQLNPQIVKERKLSSFIYQVINPLEHQLETQTKVIDFLKRLNFSINDQFFEAQNIKNVIQKIHKLTNLKPTLNYQVDGVVVKVNKISLHEEIGRTIKFPKYMIAYKFPEELVKTILHNIFPTVGRTGRITYNAQLQPVHIQGSLISAATLHNSDYIQKLNLNINDEVYIKKSGDVIPKVVSIFKKNNTLPWEESVFCPSCNDKLIRNANEVDQYCINPNCKAIILAKLEHFVSRNAMNIEGISLRIIQILYDHKIIKDYDSFFDIESKKEMILSLEGFKEKSYNNLVKAIAKSKKTTLNKLIFALGIRYIGIKNANIIAQKFKNLAAIKAASLEKIELIREIGPKAANSLYNYFHNEENNIRIDKMIMLGLQIENSSQNISNHLENGNIVITGVLTKPRNYFKNLIEINGGNVTNNISRNTSFVLMGEKPGSKLQKAKKLKIPILNEQEFINKILNKGDNNE